MYNPFYDIVKADELPPELAAELFIEEASPIWTDIQFPLNHLVIGPRGAGKTIALRQLDHKSARPKGPNSVCRHLYPNFQNLYDFPESFRRPPKI